MPILNAASFLFVVLWLASPLLNAAPADVDADFHPTISSGHVNSFAVQADGKILVGGWFTALGGQPRTNIARLNADGTLDPGFNPGANHYVYSLVVQADGKILVGGAFTNVAGQPRNCIARLNTDGSLDAYFNPNIVGSIVYCLTLQLDGKILLGGNFTSVGGQTCEHLARINTDGTPDLGFNPNANWSVSSLAVQGDGKILVGGALTALGGQPRNYIGRLNADGSLDSSFNPNANSGVSSLAVQADGKILIAGGFTRLADQPRYFFARLRSDGSLDTLFNPNIVGSMVSSVALQADGKILLGGNFTTIRGQTRNSIARLNADGSLDSGFNPDANNGVYSLALQADGKVLVGGYFTTLGGQPHNSIARLENDDAPVNLTIPGINQVRWLRSGASPEAQSVGFDLSTDGGGSWTMLGTGTQFAGGWELTGLSLPTNGLLRARARTTCGIYNGSAGLLEMVAIFPAAAIAVEHPVGIPIANAGRANFGTVPKGSSTNITFTIRNLGSLDLTGLDLTIDGPDAVSFSVTTSPIAPLSGPNGSTIFKVRFAPNSLGFKFARLRITSNDPDTNPFDIALTGNAVFPEIVVEQPSGTDIADGGVKDFGLVLFNQTANLNFAIRNIGTWDLSGIGITIDGQDAALFTVTTNPATTVTGPTGSTIFTVQFAPTNIGPKTAMLHITSTDTDKSPFYITLTGTGRNPISGDVNPGFNPDPNFDVNSFTVQTDGKVLVVGDFTTFGGHTRNYIVRLNEDGSLDTEFNPDAGGSVIPVAVQADGRILVGGYFTNLAGQPRICIARLNSDGSLDSGFNPGANDWVNSLVVQADGKILVGGAFTNLAGQSRNRVARLNTDGTLDTGFNPNANGSVYSLAVQADGKILMGGSFTTLGGQTRNRVARLNTDGSLDIGFNPNANSYVGSITVQANGKILVGGWFTALGGQPRNSIARLNADGSLDTGFNPSASGGVPYRVVNTLVVQADGRILVGGSFTTLGGGTRNHIGRLNADGTLDPGFNPNANGWVYSLAMQADGKILVSGGFTAMGGQPRNYIAQLENDAATQTLTVSNNRQVQWLRGGTSPEAQDVSFDLSTDGGTNWTPLGAGTRINGGWELSGLNLPGGLVRARARVVGGMYSGSSGLIEAIATVPFAPALGNPFFAANQFRFRLPTIPGKVYQVQFTPALGNSALWEPVRTVNGDGTIIEVSFTPSGQAGFYRVVVGP